MSDNQHRRIPGYRDFTEAEILDIREWKAREALIAGQLDQLHEHVKASGDQEAGRWVSLARTHFEIAFMFAVKSIARPDQSIGRRGT